MDSKDHALTLNWFLNEASMFYPEKEAIIFKNEVITYKQLSDKVNKMALFFKKQGIVKGDKVAVLLPNIPEMIEAYYAIPKIGAIIIPLSTRYKLLELEHILSHSEARAIVMVSEYAGTNFVDIINQIRPQIAKLEKIFIKGGGGTEGAISLDSFENIDESVMDRLETSTEVVSNENEMTLILYTSGTTGLPKGVRMNQKKILVNALDAVQRLEIGAYDTFIGMVPFSHGFATAVLFPHAVVSKAAIVVLEKFKAEEALEIIEKYKISLVYGVPAMFEMMLSSEDFGKYDFRSLRTGYVAGAPCPTGTIRRIIKDMHCNICQGYGTTEACGIISLTKLNDNEYHKLETVGSPLPCVEVKIVDDMKNELDSGQVGEIIVRGQSITMGYLNHTDLKSEVFNDDGWFYTGDLGIKDDEGYLKIVGRKKEMIIRGGFNIYPTEIEDHIYKIKGVQQVAVIGIPDEILGERICACIVPKSELVIDPDSVVNNCKQLLANYKIPDVVYIMQELPMTTNGKVQKMKLKEVIEKKCKMV